MVQPDRKCELNYSLVLKLKVPAKGTLRDSVCEKGIRNSKPSFV